MASFGTQEHQGDQSGVLKEKLWRSGFRVCPKCEKQAIKSADIVAGCRMNGDGYGTTVFTCKACKFTTSFLYDEAGEQYYYETRGWNRKPQETVAHSYAGLPPVTIDADGAAFRRHEATDQPGEWKKVGGRWVPA